MKLQDIHQTNKSKNVYNKYVSFRAVMTANGQKELPEMPKAIKDGKTLKEYLRSNDVTTLLPTEYTEVDLKANLLEAAKTAFGKAGIYNDGKEDVWCSCTTEGR